MGSSHLTDEETEAQLLPASLQGSGKERSLHLRFRGLPSSPKGQDAGSCLATPKPP